MITGSHSIIYSKDTEADRNFFKEVLRLPSVDVGSGWLIFGLPPSEIAFHPSTRGSKSEFYLLCSDIHSFVQEMKDAKVKCEEIQTLQWGYLTRITLPGGGKLNVYEPRHKRPRAIAIGRQKRRQSEKRRARSENKMNTRST